MHFEPNSKKEEVLELSESFFSFFFLVFFDDLYIQVP